MRDHWSAEEGARDRAAPRYRDRDRSERRPRSPPPPRRDDIDSYRGSARQEAESYRPSDRREYLRELDRPRPRRLSPSPRRGPSSKPLLPQQGRRLEDRITRPREPSPERLTKRRRTRSPSPTRGDYYIPGQHRDSFSRDRSRSRDRRFGAVDRAFPARRSSPVKDSRLGRRPDHLPSDTYIPSHPKRPRSGSLPRQHRVGRRSPSPRERPGTPPARDKPTKRSDQKPKELSPYSTRVQKTKTLERDEAEQPEEDMYQQYGGAPRGRGQHFHHGPPRASVQQTFGPHSNSVNRPPTIETRIHQGSPPFMTPNSSYHGSPQSTSPFYGGRGGWAGQQQQQHQFKG